MTNLLGFLGSWIGTLLLRKSETLLTIRQEIGENPFFIGRAVFGGVQGKRAVARDNN